MQIIALRTQYTLALFLAGMLAAGSAFADKPAWAGNGNKKEKSEKSYGRDRDNDPDRDRARHSESVGRRFDDHHREVVRVYYGERFRTGNCPPGLARKNNGCLPPGQAKKWRVGRPLSRELVYYDLPPALIVQLGQPPQGHRYVRVAGDILLIAVGTGMVVDAIQDLGGR